MKLVTKNGMEVLEQFAYYSQAECYRPDKPEIAAFYYPMDFIVFHNLGANETARGHKIVVASEEERIDCLPCLEDRRQPPTFCQLLGIEGFPEEFQPQSQPKRRGRKPKRKEE